MVTTSLKSAVMAAAFLQRPSAVLRWSSAAGGVVAIAIGVWMAYGTIGAGHVEGYALVLGGTLVVQGVLTPIVSLPRFTPCLH